MDWRWLRTILYLPEPASEQATRIDGLHFAVIGTTMVGAAAVLLVTLAFVVRFRRRGGAKATPVVRPPRAFEIGHTLFLLTLFLAFWGVGFAQYARMQEPPPDALEVRVVAKQWMWSFAPEGAPATLGYLVVPVARAVRLSLVSRDVIHSFYLPNFRLKRDAVPGHFTSLWFEARRPGIFPVYCAEFCGTSHSRMGADLVVLSRSDYRGYLEGQRPALLSRALDSGRARQIVAPGRPSKLTEVALGRALAREYACFTCHTIDGRTATGPTWLGLYHSEQPLEGGGVARVDEAYLRRSILDPHAQVARGFVSVMPTYYADRLDTEDVDALVAFIRSLRTDRAHTPGAEP